MKLKQLEPEFIVDGQERNFLNRRMLVATIDEQKHTVVAMILQVTITSDHERRLKA